MSYPSQGSGKKEHSIRNQVIAGLILAFILGAGVGTTVSSQVSNSANTTNGGSDIQNEIAQGTATVTTVLTSPTTVTTTSVSTIIDTSTTTETLTTTATPPPTVTLVGKVATLGFGTKATGITFETAAGYTNSPALNSTGFYNVTLPNQRTYTVVITGEYTATGSSSGPCTVPSSFTLDIGAGTVDLRMDWAC